MKAINMLVAGVLLLVVPQVLAQCSLSECDWIKKGTANGNYYPPRIHFASPDRTWWQKVQVSASSERDMQRSWLTGEALPIPERGLRFEDGNKFPVRLEMVVYETRGETSSKFSVGIHGRRGAGLLWKCTFHEFNFNC